MAPNSSDTMATSPISEHQLSSHLEIVPKQKSHWFKSELKPLNVAFVTVLHTLSLYYFITFPYLQQKFLVAWSLMMVHMIGLGVTAGVHRMWAHRTFKAKWPLRVMFAVLYYSAGMNSIFEWVRDHRVHHKFTDTTADPHDSNRGFWFSHVGWLMMKKAPEVRNRGKSVDMSDILNDPIVQFFDRNGTIMKLLFTIVLPVAIPVVIFKQDLYWSFVSQAFMRYPWILNLTWSVNSFAHLFGTRGYDKSLRPAENVYVGFISGGEGWHNYHHTFPWDYKAAEFGHLFLNVTTYWIELMAQLGLAYDLKKVDDDHIRKVVERKGDGTHVVYGHKSANGGQSDY